MSRFFYTLTSLKLLTFMQKTWWKEAIIYQIYPRSFKDANGDGIGDLRGILEKLDYLAALGIDVVWLSPHFKSPNVDNGYDISDYRDIMDAFGTMEDFDAVLAGLHERGIKLIIDLVVNHSSDQHVWFQESRKHKDNPYRDYYIWRAPKDGQPPNDWRSFFAGPTWDFDEATGEYYLHLFTKQQPDLNWENPKLRQEVYDLMRFWLDKGVDGFRMDVITFISKDPSFPNYPEGRFGDFTVYSNGPRVHTFLQEMNREVLSKYDCMTVGESFGVTADQALLYVGADRNELQTIYHFDHVTVRNPHTFEHGWQDLSLQALKAIFYKWDRSLGDQGWNTMYFGNHDNPRVISRFGDLAHHKASGKMIATLILTQRATPYLYQGDELGMTNCHFDSIAEFNDVEVLNNYQELVVEKGVDPQKYLANANIIARDHGRTPMQWDTTDNAGFTTGKPWLKINPNYPEINAAQALADPDSIFHYYRHLIALRKQHPALTYGKNEDVLPDHPQIWAYTRSLDQDAFLIVVNFGKTAQAFDLDVSGYTLQLSNLPEGETGILRPYESRIYQRS